MIESKEVMKNGASHGPAGEASEAAPILVSTFCLGDAIYALDTALVEEVVRLRRTTRVPHAPSYVLGIMNLRGKIVTVLDLGQILQLGATKANEESRLYIVRDGDGIAGLLVDRAADVIELDGHAMEPLPSSVRELQGRYFRGMARAGGRLIAVLDAAAVLSLDLAKDSTELRA
jgi:purine-binding chemotaxis protein CheW